MKTETKNLLAVFLRKNKNNGHKINLIDYLQEQICTYSNQENTHAEQIKGMNRLLRDIIKLDERLFDEKK
jgi:hypothetical protein